MNLEQTDIKQLNQFDGFIGFKLSDFYKRFLNSEARIRACFTGNQYGKCLDPLKSLIKMESGADKPMYDLVPGDMVLSVNDKFRIEPREIVSVIDSGKQATLSVKTKSGRTVYSSPTHPFLTVTGWEEVGNLSVGDRIAAANSDIYWDEIVSIEDDGVHQTCDLEIEGTHNFIANGIFVHNTAGSMYDLTLRLMGAHPVPRRNIDYYECEEGHLFTIPIIKKRTMNQNDQENLKCPDCSAPIKLIVGPIRKIRLGSENLPVDAGTASEYGMSIEGKNTQYPELKKWLPHLLIKGKTGDISIRKPRLIIRSIYGLPDMVVEFVSYSQTVQAQAGVQLKAVYLDEEPPYDFLEETRPRLIAADGDIIFALTPANRITFLFDEVFEKASIVYRTQAVADRLKFRDPNHQDYDLIEYTDSGKDIHVFQAATDDNPTLNQGQIDRAFDDIDDDLDPEIIDIRRFGLFRQQSGRIYKGLTKKHVLNVNEYFEDGIPSHWTHGRAVDYHPHVAWHHGWMAISPNDEAFIYDELVLNPESYPTKEQMFHNISKSKNYKYTVSLVDPLAKTNQVNSGKTTIQDMNDITHEFRREGFGTGGYWEPWDTKGSRGREEIRMRLKNAAQVGEPFNNLVMEKDITGATRARRLPTLWIMSNCVKSIEHMGKWRLQEHKDRDAKATKEQKETPQEKWSHLCMCYEALFKSPTFRAKPQGSPKPQTGPYDNYYRRKR